MDHIEISVLVPEDRITEFYAAYGRWIAQGTSPASGGTTMTTSNTEASVGVEPEADEPITIPSNSRYLGLIPVLEEHDEDEFSISFKEFETAIESELPASAKKHRSWWSNSSRNSQARVWLASGWRAQEVDLEEQKVTFTRL